MTEVKFADPFFELSVKERFSIVSNRCYELIVKEIIMTVTVFD